MSHDLFWKDGPFSRKSLREYPDSDLAKGSYTTLKFVDFVFCLITGLCGRKNSFGFSETFSIMLFTNWSLITWSLNISGYCSIRFKSDFRRPRLPDLFLFIGTLFLVYAIPVWYQPPLISLKLLFEFCIHIPIMTLVILFHS